MRFNFTRQARGAFGPGGAVFNFGMPPLGAVLLALADTAVIGLTESDALLVNLTLAETLPFPLTEILDLRAAFQLSETLGLGLTDIDAVLARLNLADLSEMGLDEALDIVEGIAPELLLFNLPVRLLGSDDRRMTLIGGDDRRVALVGGDDRVTALVGGPPRP